MKEYNKKIFCLWEFQSSNFDQLDEFLKEPSKWDRIKSNIGCISVIMLYVFIWLLPTILLALAFRYLFDKYTLSAMEVGLMIILLFASPILSPIIIFFILTFLSKINPGKEGKEIVDTLGGELIDKKIISNKSFNPSYVESNNYLIFHPIWNKKLSNEIIFGYGSFNEKPEKEESPIKMQYGTPNIDIEKRAVNNTGYFEIYGSGYIYSIDRGFKFPFELSVEYANEYISGKYEIIQIADTKFNIVWKNQEDKAREEIRTFLKDGGEWLDDFMDVFIALGPENLFQAREDSLWIIDIGYSGTLKNTTEKLEKAMKILTTMSRELAKLEEIEEKGESKINGGGNR